jgi:hypothetical protein
MVTKPETKGRRQIQNHSSRDDIFDKNCKRRTVDHKRNQDIMKELKIQPVTKKNQQLQTQMDTACSQNGQISTTICYYEIPTSRKKEPTEVTSGLLCRDQNGLLGLNPWRHNDDVIFNRILMLLRNLHLMHKNVAKIIINILLP